MTERTGEASWDRVKAVFGHAAELQGDARDAYVEQATSDDPALRREVESLLAGLDRSDGWWASPTLDGHGAPDDGPLPETLGRYEIRALLGAGGMGRVLLAHDPLLGRDVALKVLPRSLAEHPDRRARFLVESRAAARLNHPHITTIHEVGEADGHDYIAMEHVTGRTLAEILRARRLETGELLDVCVDLAEALAFAHEHGVIHRDIKPANVMVTDRGTVKLLDFGLAKWSAVEDEPGTDALAADAGPRSGPDADSAPGPAADDPDSAAHPARQRLTAHGEILGTPGAMSPEQVRGRPLDHRSDVFSLGSLMYQLVAGRPAFAADTTLATMSAVVRDEPPPLPDDDPRAPPALRAVIERALRKDPAERQQDMAALAADLRAVRDAVRDRARDGEGARPHAATGSDAPAETAPSGLPPHVGGALAAVLLALVALLVWSSAGDGGAGSRAGDAGSGAAPRVERDATDPGAGRGLLDPVDRALLEDDTPSPGLLGLVDAWGADSAVGLDALHGTELAAESLRRARALVATGRFEDAARLYGLATGTTAPEAAVSRDAARHGLAQLRVLQGDLVGARAAVEAALAERPDAPRNLFMVAHVARRQRDLAALLDLRARLDARLPPVDAPDPDDARLHAQALRAEQALAEGEVEDAERRFVVLLDTLAERGPDGHAARAGAPPALRPLLLRGLAECRLVLHDRAGAAAAFAELIDIGAERLDHPVLWTHALYGRGRLELELGHGPRGRASLARFLAWWGDTDLAEVEAARRVVPR